MVNSMQKVYNSAKILVDIVSRETLDLHDLWDIELRPNLCTSRPLTRDQEELLGNHRGAAGPQDVVVFFVRSTNPPFSGCSAHPAGKPAALVVWGATEWTLAHEVGHILGLPH